MAERILVASEEATSGSVIAKQERIWPRSSGSSHFSCCWVEPYLARTSMLPVSGAEQLKISEAQTDLPMISLKWAYSCSASTMHVKITNTSISSIWEPREASSSQRRHAEIQQYTPFWGPVLHLSYHLIAAHAAYQQDAAMTRTWYMSLGC